MNRILFLVILLTGLLSTACSQNDKYKVSIEEFQDSIIQDSVLLIDVRTPEEFEVSRIPGAVNIDIKSESFSSEVEELSRSQSVYLYCRSGRRSHQAATKMVEMGFLKVYDLEGGILGWSEEGYRVDSTSLDITH